MFYDTNKVDTALICKNCEWRLDVPKILPCGETICSLCETNIQVNNNNNMFDCLVCQNKHEMPKNGLIISKSLSDILAIELIRVSRGKTFGLLKESLDHILNKSNFIKNGIKNSNDFVREHCIELKNNVQLTAEEVIQEVIEISAKIIVEIDEHEQEFIKLNKNNKEALDKFNKILNELELFHSVNTEYLKKYDIDDDLIIKANNNAINLIKKADLEIQNLKDAIFDGSLLMFEKNNEKINKSILGRIKADKMIDSLILSNQSQQKKLFSLCEILSDQTWNLIYRASRDGFEAANFHAKCDNKPNTLVVIKSTNDNIFGGYTEQKWSGYGFRNGFESFIFSLINLDNRPLKIKWSQNYAIYCEKNHGPTFGGGYDLFIGDKSNTNITSYSGLGHSYIHPYYAYGSNEAKTFLAGSFNFQVIEIEVYTKRI
jgi:hypothetical protein